MANTKTPAWAYDDINGSRVKAGARSAYLWILDKASSEGYGAVWGGSSYRPMGPGEYAVDHPSGNTFDIMVASRAGGSGDRAAGDWVARQFIGAHNAGLVRVDKLIWNGQQWTPSRGWYTYSPGGHGDHVHVRLSGDSPVIGLGVGGSIPTGGITTNSAGGLVVDGVIGGRTIRAIQRWCGATVDGVMGPNTRRAVQQKLNDCGADPQLTVDGVIGPRTIRAIQAYTGAHIDGVMGPETRKAIQRTLNSLGA